MTARLKFEWGERIISLPRDVLMSALPDAEGFELKVLIAIAANDELRGDPAALESTLCQVLSCTKSRLEKALRFWLDAGVISETQSPSSGYSAPVTAKNVGQDNDQSAKDAENSGKPSKPLLSGTLPHYSESECADVISASAELPNVIDLCQQILGKIFTSADVEIIVALCDHLNLSPDYIVCLVKYCADNGKKSLRYIEKTALSLFDEGISTGSEFNEYLKRKEKLADALTQIRKMTGSAGRDLTTKEKKTFSCWLEEWKFDIDVVTKAWEVTIDKIGEPKITYMNKVLENWHNSGFVTAADVDASLEAYKKKKSEAAVLSSGKTSGFQTDEIMEAILKRSCQSGSDS